jgi:hypothetical protein
MYSAEGRESTKLHRVKLVNSDQDKIARIPVSLFFFQLVKNIFLAFICETNTGELPGQHEQGRTLS